MYELVCLAREEIEKVKCRIVGRVKRDDKIAQIIRWNKDWLCMIFDIEDEMTEDTTNQTFVESGRVGDRGGGSGCIEVLKNEINTTL